VRLAIGFGVVFEMRGAVYDFQASTDTGVEQGTTSPGVSSPSHKHKKDVEPEPEITPLVKMLQNAGPIRGDGSDKFFGMENVRPVGSLLRARLTNYYL